MACRKWTRARNTVVHCACEPYSRRLARSSEEPRLRLLPRSREMLERLRPPGKPSWYAHTILC